MREVWVTHRSGDSGRVHFRKGLIEEHEGGGFDTSGEGLRKRGGLNGDVGDEDLGFILMDRKGCI